MYKCSNCGNIKYFTELKNVATKLVCTDEGVPMPILSYDILLSVVEVSCDLCKSSTEDGLILDDDDIILNLEDQDPPDIGY